MIDLLVRHAALLAFAALLSQLLKHRSAALRHALWTTALGMLLLLPLLQRVPVALPPLLAPSLPISEPEREESRANIEGTPVQIVSTSATAQPALQNRFPWEAVGIGVYSAVTLTLIVRWGRGWALAARLARQAKPLGLARGIPVLASEGVGPLTFGWPRGVILVPHERFALETLVLRHEVAHVKRADFLWQGMGAITCALWWWSPLVWLAARQLRREAERSCDDFVLNQGVSAPDYANCLLEVAAMKPVSLPFAASLIQGELTTRVAALLAPGKDRRPAAPLAVLGITALLAPVGLTLTRPVAAEVPTEQPISPAPPVVFQSGVPHHATASGIQPTAPRLPGLSATQIATLRKQKAKHLLPTLPKEKVPVPLASATTQELTAPIVAAPQVATVVPDTASISTASLVSTGKVATDAPPTLSIPAVILPQADPVKPVDEGRASARPLMGKRIVLDPGHGGEDSGAMVDKGQEVLREKDITLLIAQKAAESLRKEGAIVTLTRETDREVDLAHRSEFSVGQDLFLSLHIDYSDISKETFSQPFRVALWFHDGRTLPSAPTRKFMEGLLTAFPQKDITPRTVDMVVRDGNVVGQTIVSVNEKDAITFAYLADTKAYPFGFAVLRKAKCPAYLIDFGNLSRPNDAARLGNSAFQGVLAQGIVEGAKSILQ